MELKHASHAAAGFSRAGFNRTFMELKHWTLETVFCFRIFSACACFNRTFMELKPLFVQLVHDGLLF